MVADDLRRQADQFIEIRDLAGIIGRIVEPAEAEEALEAGEYEDLHD